MLDECDDILNDVYLYNRIPPHIYMFDENDEFELQIIVFDNDDIIDDDILVEVLGEDELDDELQISVYDEIP